ncbi:hypothetical protein JOD02_000972 [Caldicoprobacter guelmensis]|uniref:DUF5060 domain-containing protein n=1 Tax=Caldicoprobacter guelmensis TaxID=1170224 RepID=UPI00195DF9EB|nr:DUF5060 domain-containing protein [Caldicoprobacter guelmensis]MBM7582115.1 hypothetical protein [Caldicoprobacter guelmensis]
MSKFIYPKTVEKWCVFEVTVKGPSDGNPFIDYKMRGTFHSKNETKTVEGFYDGDGIYKVRFMPSFEGKYRFAVEVNFSDKVYEGEFTVTPASKNNHGPVRVANTYHFAYEDGTPYYPIGTTCYAWVHQKMELQEKTLETLKDSVFNKVRFCIFPKHYLYNLNEPLTYPYEGTPCDSSFLNEENFSFSQEFKGNSWDFKRFNPKHFQLIEKRIQDLMDLGIEADLILWHPYDRWGFSKMSKEEDDLYLNYVIARFAAYRNVWWSLANEYDLLKTKTLQDWERFASIICEKDPYNHLRSIHNCMALYDFSRPWVTHCSIQRIDVYKTTEYVDEWRTRFKKPVIFDELGYEGDIDQGWGNLTGQEVVRRFWEAVCRGGYATHGETFVNPENILWWSHGGKLRGESAERLKFLYKILCETPGHGLRPHRLSWDEVVAVPDTPLNMGEYYLIYYGFNRPSFRRFYFDDNTKYKVEIIDTWNMTITDAGIYKVIR